MFVLVKMLNYHCGYPHYWGDGEVDKDFIDYSWCHRELLHLWSKNCDFYLIYAHAVLKVE